MKTYFSSVVMVIVLSACDSGTDPVDAVASVYESTHQCDEVTAHPDDPGKWASGVSDDELIPGIAIKYCTDAVLEHPKTPRFHFQLGRALLKANKSQEAIDAFADAAGSDYAPAFAYLADFYSSGALGEPDSEKAIAYYDIAITGGFAPAEDKKLAILGLNTKSTFHKENEEVMSSGSLVSGRTTKSNVAKLLEQSEHPLENDTNFSPSYFNKKQILSNLYNGDFDVLNDQSAFNVALYFSHLNNYFSESMNWYSESCAAYADPELKKITFQKGLDSVGLKPGGETAKQGLKILGQMANMMKNGPGALMDHMSNVEVTIQAAKNDGVKLAQLYGCASPIFERLYINMGNYLRNKEPAMASGWAGLRLECQKYSLSRGSVLGKSKQVCSCFVDTFKESSVSKDEAEWLRVNYDHGINFAEVVARNKGLKDKLGSCLL